MTISGFWFNHNIHPYVEYRERLNAVKTMQERLKIEIEYTDHYGLKKFVREVAHREASRCEYCYTTRLEITAQTAKKCRMDGFTTSLLVSPYQKFDLITEIGRIMAEKYDIEFISDDFRSGYHEGVRMSKDLGLYRQKYCGCIYSEMERYSRDN